MISRHLPAPCNTRPTTVNSVYCRHIADYSLLTDYVLPVMVPDAVYVPQRHGLTLSRRLVPPEPQTFFTFYCAS